MLSYAAQPIGTPSSAQTVTLTNISGAPLQLTSISATNNFLAVSACPAALDPNASCSIDVSFVPNTAGPYNGFLTITTSLGKVTAVLSASNGRTLRVPADFSTINNAIIAAQNGDTVLVSPGTYFEQVSFQGKAITVASLSGSAETIIDGQGSFVPVTISQNEPPQAVLKGFTITHGNFSGVVIFNSSPTLEDNVITGNTACNGQGIGIQASSSAAIIRHNVISNNVDTCGFGGQGAGVQITGFAPGGGQVQLLNNTISGNQGAFSGGGGIAVVFNGGAFIEGNTIENNSTAGNGGGIFVSFSSNADIVQNLIAGNTAKVGGGIYETVDFFGQSPLMLNNTIANNSSSSGTAVFIDGLDANVVFNNKPVDRLHGSGSGQLRADERSTARVLQ